MNDAPKFYFISSSVKGWVPSKKRYLEFETEEAYDEYLEDTENE